MSTIFGIVHIPVLQVNEEILGECVEHEILLLTVCKCENNNCNLYCYGDSSWNEKHSYQFFRG